MSRRSSSARRFLSARRLGRGSAASRRLRVESLEQRTLLAVLYVNQQQVAGTQTGSSWASSFTDLQPALEAAQAGDEIWLGRGSYSPTQTDDRTKSFVLKDGVAIYGGFFGTETNRSERRPDTYEPVLTGFLPGTPFPRSRVYHVVTVPSGVSAILDGVRITGGLADGPGAGQDVGGGIINEGRLALNDVLLSGHEANSGGAIYNTGQLTITGANIRGNSAQRGGAVANAGTLSIRDTSFSHNSAAAQGGALYVTAGTVEVVNSTFLEHSAADGAAITHEGGRTTVRHSSIAFNTTPGSAVRRLAGLLQLDHTLIAGGTRARDIAGHVDPNSRYNFMGVVDNTDDDFETDLQHGVLGNQVGSVAAPLDAKIALPGYIPYDQPFYVALAADSPAVDAGDPAFSAATFSPPMTTDVRGLVRVVDGDRDGTPRIDIGATELNNHRLVVATTADEMDVAFGEPYVSLDFNDLSLREALYVASLSPDGGEVVIPAGVYQREGFDSYFDAFWVGGAEVTISGAGMGQTVIDAAEYPMALGIVGGRVVVRDLTIRGASAPGGLGGVHIDEDGPQVEFERVEITGNSGACGGVYIDEDTTVTFTDSWIHDNHGSYSGGGICAGQGLDSLSLVRTTVERNTSAANGGGMLVHAVRFDVIDSVIRQNSAGEDGGGIFASYITSLANSRVEENTAGDAGGGVILQGGGLSNFTDSRILNNVADNGGGIYTTAPLTVTGGEVSGNDVSAGGKGGGLYVAEGAEVSLQSTAVSGNTTDQEGQGGGAYVAADSTVRIDDTQFTGNLADGGSDGAGLYVAATTSPEDVLVTDSTFSGNDADGLGGAIYVAPDAGIVVSRTTIADNTAAGGGGIILADSQRFNPTDSAILTNLVLRGNTADLGAGLCNGLNRLVQLSDSTIAGNTATVSGGGFYNQQGIAQFNDVAITDNRSGIYGAGVYNENGYVQLTSVDVADNQAGFGGGGIASRGDGTPDPLAPTLQMRLTNTTVHGNRSLGDGGGIFLENFIADRPATLQLVQSTISGNTSDAHGGAIANRSTRVIIHHSTIADNVAGSVGGVYSPYGGGGSVNHSILVGNRNIGWPPSNPGLTADLYGCCRTSLDAGVSYSIIGATPEFEWLQSLPGVLVGSPQQPLTADAIGLLPLDYNGGPLLTHALRPGSLAIDAGSPSFNPDSFSPPLVRDQRGQLRATAGATGGTPRVDVGAVEYTPGFLFGDLNQDGRVGVRDLLVLRQHLGALDAVYAQGDLNADGQIDRTDQHILTTQLGKTLPSTPAAAPAARVAVVTVSDESTRVAPPHPTIVARRVTTPPSRPASPVAPTLPTTAPLRARRSVKPAAHEDGAL